VKFLSLFDGCHMFGHALRNVGAECVGTSEIDKHAAAVTSYHYPQTPALGDVQNVKSTNADLIVAGFPCQDLSVAGDRRGLAGERSGLFWEIVRIARDNATPWLLLENVPGLLSSNGGRDMGAVVGALGELGYGWAYRVLDAHHFGVPQRRRRVFIVGCLGDARRAGEVLFEPESVRGDSAPSGEAGASSAGCIGAGSEGVARCLTAHAGRLDADTEDFVVTDLAQVTNADNRSNPQPGDPSPTLASTGRPAPFNWRGDDYAPGVRRLMPIECERLQGLPDDWTKHGRKSDGTTYEQSDSARYRMIGNGGAVPVVEWIGRRTMKQEARV
jgi:DNA (cytosine-5)-methyltransferase 1